MAINFNHQLNTVTTSNGDLDIDITGSIKVPSGTTIQRSASLFAGQIRFNNQTGLFEGYNGTSWITFGSLTDKSINTLQDVNITTPVDGQAMIYNATSGKWENQVIVTEGDAIAFAIALG
mgnify:FL=1